MRDDIRALIMAAKVLAATCTTCFGVGKVASQNGAPPRTCPSCGGSGNI